MGILNLFKSNNKVSYEEKNIEYNNDIADRKNRIVGSLIGGAIGDALGYQIEFKRNVQEKEVVKYKNDKGIISDDTQMTLFTANGLIWRETRGAMRGIALLPSDAVYESYLDWLDTQNNTNNHDKKISWIKDIKELNVPRAPGNTCISALSSGKKGTIENPINNSKGCGGIMRVAPLGLYMRNPEYAGKYAAEVSAITHGHPLANIPSYVFATMIYFILNDKLNIGQSLNKAMIQYKEKFNVYDKKNNEYFENLVKKAIKLSKENMSDIDAINQLGEGWVAEETFAIAIYSCLKYQNSFENAIICAVNHDGDSDSTGAIAGNIMGVYLGYNSIPKYYVDNLELKDVIYEIAEDLSSEIPIGEYNNNNDEYWLSKYLYCKKKKYLYRNEFINLADSDKIWSKTMTLLEIKGLLQLLESSFSKYDFEIDKNFIMNSRRKGLEESIVNRLSKSEIKRDDILESLFNFWEFVQDEYFGDFILISKELGLTIQELTIMDENYRNKGIISEQEKQIILEIIALLRKTIVDN
jgi:ADP-ribosylglycohydrolase